MRFGWDRRTLLQAFAAAFGGAALGMAASSSVAAGPLFFGRTLLVMVDDPGCIYCRKWEREVESGYRLSGEGAFAPLEKRHKGHGDLSGLSGLAYTPTFVLIHEGVEVGRIIGYAGQDWFWGEIEGLFRKAGFQTPPAAPSVDERRT